MEEQRIQTDIFTLFEIGKNYNRNYSLYEDGEDNYDYYHGRQWKELKKELMKIQSKFSKKR